jgi:hypothetical protein
MHTGFGWGNLRGRDHMEYLGLDGRIILNGSSRREMGAWSGVIWFRLGMGDWVLYAVMNLKLPSKCGEPVTC